MSKIKAFLERPSSRVFRPCYRGALTYEDENGDPQPILNLPKYPRVVDFGGVGPGLGLTPAAAELFVRAIRGGNTVATACGIVGMSPQTYIGYRNLALDAKENETEFEKARREYLFDFLLAVERAYALAEADWISVVMAAAEGRLPKTKKVTKEVITYPLGHAACPRGGQQIREVTEEIEAPPDFKAAQWLLEHTRQGSYAIRRAEQLAEQAMDDGDGPSPLKKIAEALDRISLKELPSSKPIDAEFTEVE